MLCLNYFFCRYEMRFNMKTGSASQKKLSPSAVDFPRINECYTGKYEFTLVLVCLIFYALCP